MNIVGKTSLQQRQATLSTATLIRLSGLAAGLAGLGFIVVGLFHPVNVPAAVTTATWVNVHIVAMAMALLGLIGMTGLYARQAEKIGWLGLAGYGLRGRLSGGSLYLAGSGDGIAGVCGRFSGHV